jgi:hypothetical protein
MVGKHIIFHVSGLNDNERNVEDFKDLFYDKMINFKYLGVTKQGIPISANINRG